jgi:DNA-binding transcriptional regulator YiaG
MFNNRLIITLLLHYSGAAPRRNRNVVNGALKRMLDRGCNNCYKRAMSPKQIRALRKDLELTQQQLADWIAAQRVTVARWEIGTSRPTGAYLKSLLDLREKAKTKKSKGG